VGQAVPAGCQFINHKGHEGHKGFLQEGTEVTEEFAAFSVASVTSCETCLGLCFVLIVTFVVHGLWRKRCVARTASAEVFGETCDERAIRQTPSPGQDLKTHDSCEFLRSFRRVTTRDGLETLEANNIRQANVVKMRD
jgi:hypothetical protein